MPLTIYLTILLGAIGAAGLTVALLTQSLGTAALSGAAIAILAITALVRWKT